MTKNYRNKDACLKEAMRLGIKGAEEMNWPTLQKTVSEALKLEEMGVDVSKLEESIHKAEQKLMYGEGETFFKVKDTEVADARKPDPEAEKLRPYIDKTIIISPELSPERYRLLKYDEDLGPDYDVVERQFDIDPQTDQVFDISGELGERNSVDQYHDYLTGTYRLKRRSDRRVVAMSSVPKENSGMLFRPGVDLVPVVTWNGRSGYLWQHMFLPNIKQLLMESGHYAEYRDKFVGEPNVWYAAGKQLVCDPHLVHQVFQEIEEKEQRRLENSRTMGWR